MSFKTHAESFTKITFRVVFEFPQLFVHIKDCRLSSVSPFCPSQIRTTTQSPQEHQQLIVKALNQVACGKSCINLKRQRSSKQKCCVNCYCDFLSWSTLSDLENYFILWFCCTSFNGSTIQCKDYSIFFSQEGEGKQFPLILPYLFVYHIYLFTDGPFLIVFLVKSLIFPNTCCFIQFSWFSYCVLPNCGLENLFVEHRQLHYIMLSIRYFQETFRPLIALKFCH